MEMFKIKRIPLEDEKYIIIGMIISDIFIRDIEKLLNNLQLIKSSYIRQLIRWSLDYYNKYRKAPQQLIVDIFDVKKSEIRNEKDIQNIEDTLQHLIDEYLNNLVVMQNYNHDHFLERAVKYLKKRNLELLMINMQAAIDSDELEEADNCIVKYRMVEKVSCNGIDLLNDTDKIIEILTTEHRTLFTLPGAMGEAFQGMYRGDLLAIGAPQKRGKTWMLMYLAAEALISGLKVCYWTKEMKDIQMVKRFFQYFLGEINRPEQDFIKTIRIPHFDDNGNIRYREIKRTGMSIDAIIKMQKKLKLRSRTGAFKLFDISSGGGTILDIDTKLENLSYYDDFWADVVLVDYFDILDRAKGASRDKMEAINEIWLAGKSIAQKRNLLMCTVSQLSKKTFSKDATMENVADDIRKWGHVSHWANLNQSKEEKARDIWRVQVQGRLDKFKNDEVVCLQGLDIGRPVLDSRWKSEIPNYDDWLEKPLEEEIE